MELTPENKDYIDRLSYMELLKRWRFDKIPDPWFEGETGKYWSQRLAELRSSVDYVAISKRIGWKDL